MPNTFCDYFDQYAKAQDKWIYYSHWSSPEHSHYAYILEESANYEGGDIVECIYMLRSENNINNLTSTYLHKGKQSQEIWSGYVDSPDEYQVLMSAVNKFIEEYKNTSGAI